MTGRRVIPTRSRKAVWRAAERSDYAGPLLLDTHVWVWLLEGRLERVAPAATTILARAAEHTALYVSDISFWEIAQKASRGKLALSVEPALWLARAERAPGLLYVPLDRAVLVQSTLLSGLPGDPADRMLVATAQLHSLPLITLDENIIRYATSRRGVPVCDARP